MNKYRSKSQRLNTQPNPRQAHMAGRRLAVELLEDRRLLSVIPQLIADINLLPNQDDSALDNFCQVGGTTFFCATTALSGNELWRSDGTVAGTFLVKDKAIDGKENKSLETKNFGSDELIYTASLYLDHWNFDDIF